MKKPNDKIYISQKNIEHWHQWLKNLEADKKDLEVFLIQSAYIEGLLRLFTDINFDLATGGFNSGKNQILISLQKRIRRYQLGDLIVFLKQCNLINENEEKLLKEYKDKRNTVIHDLFSEIYFKGFIHELSKVLKLGDRIISFKKFSVIGRPLVYDSKTTRVKTGLKKEYIKITSRAEEMLSLYLSGDTYEKIGKKFNISRERVRQILEDTSKRLHQFKFGIQFSTITATPSPVTRVNISREKEKKADIIIETVAKEFGVTLEAIKSRSRVAKTIIARHVAYYLLREQMHFSYPKIGKVFDRDHTTIIHGYEKIKKLVDSKNLEISPSNISNPT